MLVLPRSGSGRSRHIPAGPVRGRPDARRQCASAADPLMASAAAHRRPAAERGPGGRMHGKLRHGRRAARLPRVGSCEPGPRDHLRVRHGSRSRHDRPAGPPAGRIPAAAQQRPCYSPHQFRVAYGIQPLLDSGIDGRGETVTVAAPTPTPASGYRHPPGPGGVRPHVPAARRADPGRDHPRRGSRALAGGGRGGRGLRDGARGRPRRHAPGGPVPPRHGRTPRTRPRTCSPGCGWPSPAPTWPRSAGAWENTFSPRLRWPRCTPSCSGRPLTMSRWSPVPATMAGSATPGGSATAGQGGQPSGLRPARAGRGRHHAHRESLGRRLHQRDRLECPERLL